MSKQQKLLNKFLEIPPKKNLTFDELESLLISLGYKKLEGSGSRVKFYNEEIDDMINLHKPHPDNKLKVYLIKQIQEKLKNGGFDNV